MLRKVAGSTNPTVQLIKNDDETFTFSTKSTFKNSDMTFTPGIEFIEETQDGRKMKCIVTIEGNKMIQQQFGEGAAKIEREFHNDQMILKIFYKDIVVTRWFKAIE
jgi:fatty acid-binding protein 3, muscle and heart